MSVPLLAVTYAFHLISTVIWLGGLLVLVAATWPSLTHSSDSSARSEPAILQTLERRFRPWSNISLMVLLVTGLIQMGADEHYQGLLLIDSPWAIGLLAKHVVIGGILVSTGLLQWGIYPALGRARLLAEKSRAQGAADEARLRDQIRNLTVLNAVLGIIVLLLTAVITAL